MKELKEYSYALCSSKGAGYYEDFSLVEKAEPYIDDAQITKLDSIEKARKMALEHLHTLNPDLKDRFNLLPDYFQRSDRLKPTDFSEEQSSKPTPLDPWTQGGNFHA